MLGSPDFVTERPLVDATCNEMVAIEAVAYVAVRTACEGSGPRMWTWRRVASVACEPAAGWAAAYRRFSRRSPAESRARV